MLLLTTSDERGPAAVSMVLHVEVSLVFCHPVQQFDTACIHRPVDGCAATVVVDVVVCVVLPQSPYTVKLVSCACHHKPERYFYPHTVSQFRLVVRCYAGKQKDLSSILLWFSLLFKRVVVCGHCLVTLSLTVNETLKWLSSLPILMQESFWW